MSVSIIVFDTDDKGMALENGYWARQLDVGSNWTQLRIGLITSMSSSDSQFLGGYPRFYFGLCNGTSNVPGRVVDAEVSHSLGIISDDDFWLYDATPGMYLGGSTGDIDSKLIESGAVTQTNVTGAAASRWYIGSPDSDYTHHGTFLQINKDTSWSGEFVRRYTTSSPYNMDVDVFVDAMERSSPSSLNGYTSSSLGSFSVDEGTHGALDSVFVMWDRTSVAMHIGAIAVAKIS